MAPVYRRETEAALVAELNVRKAAAPELFMDEGDEALARAALFAGRHRDAKALLQKVTSYGNASARAWNDYAVVLHATAAPDDALQLTTALAAADRALDLEAALPEALFNRGVLLEALSLRGAAVAAFKTYLAVDASSAWAAEARERMQKLEATQARIASWRENLDDLERAAEAGDELFINDIAVAYPEESRRWCDLYLARWGERLLAGDADGAAAMLLLCRAIGRALEKERGESLIADAVRIIDTASDPRPLAHAHIRYERGRKALARGENNRAAHALDAGARQFREHRSPMAFAARLYAIQTVSDSDRAASSLRALEDEVPPRYRALHAQMQWARGMIATREGSQTTALAALRNAAAAFEALGEEGNARRVRNSTAAVLSAAGDTDGAWRMAGASMRSSLDDEETAFTCFRLAHVAANEERWDIVHALLNAIAQTPRVNELIRGEAMTWRVVAAQRANMPRIAERELRAERQSEHALNDLHLAEALIAKPENAIGLLSQALRTAKDDGSTARLLVARARALRAVRLNDGARADLERAVALLERGNIVARADRLRDAIVGSPLDAYSTLAEALDRDGHTARAEQILERFRAWPRRAMEETIHVRQHTSSGSLVLITYALFAERVAIYAKGQRTSVRIASREVKESVHAFHAAIDGNDVEGFRKHGLVLSRTLMKPIAKLIKPGDLLVIVPDAELERVPFGALVQQNGRYLIEDHAVVLASSMTAWVKASQHAQAASRAVLSVGNATSDAEMVSLPAAEAEAKEIAVLYDSRALLTGAEATKQRVISALAYSNVAHFAVHANGGDATQPHLVLSTPDGRLTASEIAALKLDNMHAVVLAGCRTTAGARSLVDAFLEAGAGNVVGTLWDVDDAGTREMSVAFHRALRDGDAPAEALRKAQTEMIRRKAPLRVWAALQLYGSGS
jgi:CHAT domain-containing protein